VPSAGMMPPMGSMVKSLLASRLESLYSNCIGTSHENENVFSNSWPIGTMPKSRVGGQFIFATTG
jgi:hypothetical protein